MQSAFAIAIAIAIAIVYVLCFSVHCFLRCIQRSDLLFHGRSFYCMNSIRRLSTYKFRLDFVSFSSKSLFIFNSFGAVLGISLHVFFGKWQIHKFKCAGRVFARGPWLMLGVVCCMGVRKFSFDFDLAKPLRTTFKM